MTDWRSTGPAPARWIAGMAVLAVVWLAMLSWGGGALDRSIYEALYAGHRPALATAAHLATDAGEPTLVIALAVIVALGLWHAGRGRGGLVLILVASVGRGLVEAQKYGVARARPAIEPHLVVVKTGSFPSGHAANSMIFYLALALLFAGRSRWRSTAIAAAIAAALLIGLSRVMLGVHWPSDIVAGWSFGILWVMAAWPYAARFAAGHSVSVDKPL